MIQTPLVDARENTHNLQAVVISGGSAKAALEYT